MLRTSSDYEATGNACLQAANAARALDEKILQLSRAQTYFTLAELTRLNEQAEARRKRSGAQ